MKLDALFSIAWQAIGGTENADVKWYLNGRPKLLTRKAFFEAYVFAVWVAGFSRASAESFLARCEESGFQWDYEWVSTHTPSGWKQRVSRYHYNGLRPTAWSKWEAVHTVARKLVGFSGEQEFRQEWFSGKTKTIHLQTDDAYELVY